MARGILSHSRGGDRRQETEGGGDIYRFGGYCGQSFVFISTNNCPLNTPPPSVSCLLPSGGAVIAAVYADQFGGFALENGIFGNDDPYHTLEGWNIVHDVQHHFLDDGTQGACPGATGHGFLRNGA